LTLHLPTLNACLNGTAAVLLFLGWRAIKRGKPETHARFMKAALATSILFLISYGIHHSRGILTRYERQDWTRPLYLAILISHTILAVVIVPMVIMTVRRAFKGEFARHKQLARWTLPIWFYVSVTGVVIYLMLYQMGG